jgi:formate dehydrogenase gamma subunit
MKGKELRTRIILSTGKESVMSSNSHKVAEENKMIRRFDRSEIILHWANAVPFLILLATGALNILSHFVKFLPSFLSALRTIHKIFGVLWIVSVGFSFLFIGRRLNIANLRDQICIGISDITWMIKALRSIYNPYIKTPPAGKFNTGQKINAVLVILYAVAFTGSGALMWAYNTMLFPWFFHVSVFFMAVASVGGHLYLSLLHPSTRPGLIGIFNGMVPKSYVIHHHSLMIEGAANAYRETVPANGVFMKAEIVILVLALIGGGFGVEVLGPLPRPDLKRGFESLVTPGELSKAHSIKEIDDCKKCHEYSGEIPERKCLSCHKIIQTRMEARLGYHGKNKDDCIHCHKEHPGAASTIINFDKEKFNHAAAAFKLEGKHTYAKCEVCHKRKISEDGNNPAGYYVGLRFDACLDCHKDVHAGAFGEKRCETCHSAAGWKGKDLKFDHGSAKYRLEGKHASVRCEKCHKPQAPGAALGTAVFSGMKFGLCDDCHKDPHRKKFRAACATCHSVQSWRDKDLKFDHGRDTKFRLEGKHESVKCVKCHKATTKNGSLDVSSFTTKHQSCSDCHKDPHRGELAARCTACHSVQGWRDKDLKFDHGRDTKFKLEGKHEPVKCVKCHKATTKNGSLDVSSFRTKHQSCSNCHKDPHRGELAAKCTACHSVQGWRDKDLKFDHGRDTKFRLEGKHEPVKCVKCHKATTKNGSLDVSSFKINKYETCSPCHKQKHLEKFAVTCEKCHNFVSWKSISWKRR